MRLNIPKFNGNILATVLLFVGSVVLDAGIREYIKYRVQKRLKKGVYRSKKVTGQPVVPLGPAKEQKTQQPTII